MTSVVSIFPVHQDDSTLPPGTLGEVVDEFAKYLVVQVGQSEWTTTKKSWRRVEREENIERFLV